MACASGTQPIDRSSRTVWLPGTPAVEIYTAARYVMQAHGSVTLDDRNNRLIEGAYGDFGVRMYFPPEGSTFTLTCTHPAPWRSGTVPAEACLDDLEGEIRSQL